MSNKAKYNPCLFQTLIKTFDRELVCYSSKFLRKFLLNVFMEVICQAFSWLKRNINDVTMILYHLGIIGYWDTYAKTVKTIFNLNIWLRWIHIACILMQITLNFNFKSKIFSNPTRLLYFLYLICWNGKKEIFSIG